MRILLSNDDGVYAPGINTLKNRLKAKYDLNVIAPLEERSTTGHTLTLDQPLRLEAIEENVYGCSGHPADCVLMGVGHLFVDKRPDIVVSGINRGANLGQDIYYSGTCAAAREAVYRGLPAIAVSSAMSFYPNPNEKEHFHVAALVLDIFLSMIDLSQIRPYLFLNINIPNIDIEKIKGVKLTRPGFRYYSEQIEERTDFRGRSYYWIGGVYEGFRKIENSDCDAIDDQYVSLSVIDLLNHEVLFENYWQELCEKVQSSLHIC
ncbi:MAG: 5'/3'-nucleotidase SurE [Halobacteriovoraceae bacterium]|nr:5'/3'-nucleotidase SurE [Halobacteriovoraceae bacterium]